MSTELKVTLLKCSCELYISLNSASMFMIDNCFLKNVLIVTIIVLEGNRLIITVYDDHLIQLEKQMLCNY